MSDHDNKSLLSRLSRDENKDTIPNRIQFVKSLLSNNNNKLKPQPQLFYARAIICNIDRTLEDYDTMKWAYLGMSEFVLVTERVLIYAEY